MPIESNLASLLERFFVKRLMSERHVSPHTIASYRDTFRLLLQCATIKLKKEPSALVLEDLDSQFISSFLDELAQSRKNSARSRNLRLTAIRSFFRYAAFEEPTLSHVIQRVLSIPSKKYDQTLIGFLTKPEIEALLAAPDMETWTGRRDRVFITVAVQTGLRLSEMTALCDSGVHLGRGAHVRCIGKGRKERCVPLTKFTVPVVKAWLEEPRRGQDGYVFPNAQGERLSSDAVQHMLAKHVDVARRACLSLEGKRVTPHVLRHTAAMELLQAGFDRSVIALWLGHESIDTTQVYIDANVALTEQALAKASAMGRELAISRYRPDDQLMAFLKSL
jgi:integrase/recombinase XerD